MSSTMSEYVVLQVNAPGEGGEGPELGRTPRHDVALLIGRSAARYPPWFRVYRDGKMVVEEQRDPSGDLMWDDKEQKHVPVPPGETGFEGHIPVAHLMDDSGLSIRVGNVSEDTVPGVIYELLSTGHPEGDGTRMVLTIIQESPAYRAMDEKPDRAWIIADTASRLRGNLLQVAEILKGMPERRGEGDE